MTARGDVPVPGAKPIATAIRQADPEEEAEDKPIEVQSLLRSAPPWLVSTVVHLIVFIVMALIPLVTLL
ncbi:MAG: hypothetical protein WD176_07025, partial [Pirellulales bacterium]